MKKGAILIGLIGLLMFIVGTASAKPPLNPPNNPDDALILLGKSIYNDKNLSINNNQSCKSCHHNNTGFADIANVKNPSKNVVSNGSITTLTGGLNAPTAAYAGFSPKMYWDGIVDLYIGGIFWNGRASGHKAFYVDCLANGFDTDPIYSPLAEQSQGPFTNPVEMALPSNDEVVARVAASTYAYLFDIAFGIVDFNDINRTFDQIAIAIAAFEDSDTLVKFSSDYDLGLGEMTVEKAGLDLFEGKAKCAACHVIADGPGEAQFTDFSYDNLGIPINPLIAAKGIDPGLGGFINAVLANPTVYPASLVTLFENGSSAADNMGKHKVSTLRNIAITPPYGHNGFFPNLTSIVQFYNTRDIYQCDVSTVEGILPVGGIPVTPALLADNVIPGYPENEYNGYCWPSPEIGDNVNIGELGNLGLLKVEVDSIVSFLQALTDQ